MKRIFLLATLAIAISSTKTTAQIANNKKPSKAVMENKSVKQSDIAFEQAENYFTKNGTKPSVVKISTQAEFDNYFGAATTMKSSPTKIDFSKKFVLAVIGGESNRDVSLKAKSITKNAEGTLTLHYRRHLGKKQGHSSIASLILIVDKQKAGPGSFKAVEIK